MSPAPPEPFALLHELQDRDDDSDRRSWWLYALALLLALLVHLLFFTGTRHWGFGLPEAPRVDVRPMDMNELAKIRRKWRDTEKPLLLDKNPSAPKSEEVPDNARFQSDRNQKFEHEQRARRTDVLPKPQTGVPNARTEANRQPKPVPNLGSLGIPLHMPPKTPHKMAQAGNTGTPGDLAVDQTTLEDQLPEGSENLLNTQESKYYSFYSRLYEALAPVWQSRINDVARAHTKVHAGDYVTVLEFVLDREGKVVDLKRVQGSGMEVFDRVAEDAFHKVAQFPNPPQALLDENGELHSQFSFTVRMAEGVGFQMTEPERVY